MTGSLPKWECVFFSSFFTKLWQKVPAQTNQPSIAVLCLPWTKDVLPCVYKSRILHSTSKQVPRTCITACFLGKVHRILKQTKKTWKYPEFQLLDLCGRTKRVFEASGTGLRVLPPSRWQRWVRSVSRGFVNLVADGSRSWRISPLSWGQKCLTQRFAFPFCFLLTEFWVLN